MIIAYRFCVYDDDTHMLGPDTYRPPRTAGFHDWRFGKDGVPHPATCPNCGRKTDSEYVNPKQGCEGVTFVPLPADRDFFVLRLANVVPFDAKRRKTRFEDLCPKCGGFYNVIGATPVYPMKD